MKKAVLLALTVFLFGFGGPAGAVEFKLGDIVIADPWARASATKMMKTGAAFLTLSNHGAASDRLIAAQTPVAKKAELHTHTMTNGIMKMRQVAAIEVPPGTPTMLQPGGFHVMFMGLHAPLKFGTRFPITLIFEKAGKVEIEAVVLKPGAKGPGHGMNHKKGG